MSDEATQRVETLIAIAQTACDNAAQQYDDYYKTFVALDTKAQSTATVGGVVIASIVAFVNAGKLDSLVRSSSGWGYFCIFSPAAGALIAVVISVFASKVVEVTPPFAADDQVKEMQDLANLPAEELSKEHVLSYHHSRLAHWKDALDSISTAVDKKADSVWSGQVVLVFAFACLLLLLAALVNQARPTRLPYVPVDPFLVVEIKLGERRDLPACYARGSQLETGERPISLSSARGRLWLPDSIAKNAIEQVAAS